MSELNKKKNSSFIFLVIYTIFIITITIIAIYFHKINGIGIIDYLLGNKETLPKNEVEEILNKNDESNNNINSQQINTTIKKLSLDDTFKMNNLKEENDSYEYGEENEYNERKIKINYSQISGLKDKELENRINQLLETTSKEFVTSEEAENPEIKDIRVTSWIMGNFSDLISVCISKTIDYKDSEYKSDVKTINLRLDTGEKIDFEDLFLPNTSIKSVITQSAYNSISQEINMQQEFENAETADYSVVENLTYKALKEFEKKEEKVFYFTQSHICIPTSITYIEIPMIDFYENINIFNIVSDTEDLYENGDTLTDIYVFGQDYSAGMEFDGKIAYNAYLTVYNYDKLQYSFDPDNVVVEEENLNIYAENLDKMKEFLAKNAENLPEGKGVFYNIHGYGYDEDNNITFYCDKIEVDNTNFDEEIKKIYQKTVRANPGAELIFTLPYEEYSEEIEGFSLVLIDDEFVIE